MPQGDPPEVVFEKPRGHYIKKNDVKLRFGFGGVITLKDKCFAHKWSTAAGSSTKWDKGIIVAKSDIESEQDLHKYAIMASKSIRYISYKDRIPDMKLMESTKVSFDIEESLNEFNIMNENRRKELIKEYEKKYGEFYELSEVDFDVFNDVDADCSQLDIVVFDTAKVTKLDPEKPSNIVQGSRQNSLDIFNTVTGQLIAAMKEVMRTKDSHHKSSAIANAVRGLDKKFIKVLSKKHKNKPFVTVAADIDTFVRNAGNEIRPHVTADMKLIDIENMYVVLFLLLLFIINCCSY